MGRWLVASVVVLSAACSGAGPAERSATRRLTAEEWQNTVRDLLGVEIERARLPADELTAGFPNNVSGGLGEFDVENYLAVAESAAAEAVADWPALWGCGERTRACAAAGAPDFLRRAYRRPPTEQEVTDLLGLYDGAGTHQDGMRLMITGALVSGSFLYRPETEGEAASGGRVRLTDYEVASRLSYLLWRTMPDDALLDAAEAGQLSRPANIGEQAARMLADPKAGQGIASFHLDWLGLANASLLDRRPPPEDADEVARVQLMDLPAEDWAAGDVDGVLYRDEHEGDRALLTQAEGPGLVGIHGLDLGTTFRIRGRLMAEQAAGEVGIGFLIDPSDPERRYVVARQPDGTFHLSSPGCDQTSRFTLEAEEWLEFEISGRVLGPENVVSVNVWPYGTEPDGSADLYCKDESVFRPTRGTFGVWAGGPGGKSWAALQGQVTRPVPFDFGPYAEAYVGETRAFLAEWLDSGGEVRELLAADWTMANQRVAEVYGLSGITGLQYRRVSLPPERAGLLTQPLFLSAFAKPDQSSPVLRGVGVRHALLCEVLPSPPPDVAIVAPDPAPNATTRERFAVHTEDPACASCHVLIDPVGFGFEGFDQLGGYRTEENGKPIDATGELIGAGPADGAFDGVAELALRLADAERVRECVARSWYRYSVARLEGSPEDDPGLAAALAACDGPDCRLHDIVEAIVQSEGFRFRAAHEGDAP